MVKIKLVKPKRIKGKEKRIWCKFKFVGRPTINEQVIVHLAVSPANEERHIVGSIPVTVTPGIDPTVGYISYRFLTEISNPFCLILNFQNALSIQSKEFFSEDMISVDLTDTNQVKGGKKSLINGMVPVGDINGNGLISSDDYTYFLPYLGTHCLPQLDLDKNGIMNEDDFDVLKKCFNRSSAVEIPSALKWV